VGDVKIGPPRSSLGGSLVARHAALIRQRAQETLVEVSILATQFLFPGSRLGTLYGIRSNLSLVKVFRTDVMWVVVLRIVSLVSANRLAHMHKEGRLHARL